MTSYFTWFSGRAMSKDHQISYISKEINITRTRISLPSVVCIIKGRLIPTTNVLISPSAWIWSKWCWYIWKNAISSNHLILHLMRQVEGVINHWIPLFQSSPSFMKIKMTTNFLCVNICCEDLKHYRQLCKLELYEYVNVNIHMID